MYIVVYNRYNLTSRIWVTHFLTQSMAHHRNIKSSAFETLESHCCSEPAVDGHECGSADAQQQGRGGSQDRGEQRA